MNAKTNRLPTVNEDQAKGQLDATAGKPTYNVSAHIVGVESDAHNVTISVQPKGRETVKQYGIQVVVKDDEIDVLLHGITKTFYTSVKKPSTVVIEFENKHQPT